MRPKREAATFQFMVELLNAGLQGRAADVQAEVANAHIQQLVLGPACPVIRFLGCRFIGFVPDSHATSIRKNRGMGNIRPHLF